MPSIRRLATTVAITRASYLTTRTAPHEGAQVRRLAPGRLRDRRFRRVRRRVGAGVVPIRFRRGRTRTGTAAFGRRLQARRVGLLVRERSYQRPGQKPANISQGSGGKGRAGG